MNCSTSPKYPRLSQAPVIHEDTPDSKGNIRGSDTGSLLLFREYYAKKIRC